MISVMCLSLFIINRNNTAIALSLFVKITVILARFEDFFNKNRRFFHRLLKIFLIRIADFLYLCSLKINEL